MHKKKKIALITGCALAAILLFITTILPVVVRGKAVEAIQQATGRKAAIESVAINPFGLTITVKGLAILGEGGGPFVRVARLRASLSIASLYKRALVLDEVTLDTPAVSFARIASNRYSFSDIIERQKQAPKAKKKGEILYSINNITVHNGSLDFEDRAVGNGRTHTVRKLEVAIPFISNIPYLVETYTDPKISAVVNDAPFNFAGKLKPLSKSMETSIHIELKQLGLPKYFAYLPVKTPVDLKSGQLTIDSDIVYRISADKKPALTVKGMFRLDDIAVNLEKGQPLLRLPLLEVKASDLEIFGRRFAFESIMLDGCELFASRDNRGEWMYSRLLPRTPPGDVKKPDTKKGNEAAKSAVQPAILVSSLAFKNGTVHFSDSLPKNSFRATLSAIDLNVKNFSNAKGALTEYELSLLLDQAADFSSEGAFSLEPLAARASAELTGLAIQRGWPYLSRFLTSPVKGTLDLAGDLTFSKENGLAVERGKVALKGLSARYGDKEGFDLALLEVNGASFRQKDNSLEISDIRLSRGNIKLSRETDGSISLLSLLAAPQSSETPDSSRPKEAKATTSGGKEAAKPLSYKVKQFQLGAFNLELTDKSREEKPHFSLRNTSLKLSNLNGPRFTPASIGFRSTFGRATPLEAKGEITPLPFRYKGSINIGRLPIRDFEAYFPDNINVFIIDGYVDTSMRMDIALKEGKPSGSFMGSAGVRGFHSIDAVEEEDLLKWESLHFDDIQGNLEPLKLNIRQVALNNVYSRIIVRKDGTLNLQNLVEKPGAAPQTAGKTGQQSGGAPSAPPPPATPPGSQAKPAAPKQINIGAVTIQDGTIAFTDLHLPQTFSSTFFNLGGRVSGLSSEESKFADLDLRGNLENHSPLQITGRLNPLRDDLFVDLKVSFRDIDLSPVTPYSGTYLGYTVDKGKLFLDLKYLIDKKQLNSENKIFIDQFTFGRKVESAKATNLPVRLAVALLKDRKGEIHLDVPVTGRTDDPKFSVWGVVWQVLKNLVVKAATSPFALLSSMFGGGSDFSAILFDNGSGKLRPQEEQKLAGLAKALADRPGLKVEIKGYVDRERDAEGYRRELLDYKLRNEKFLTLAKERRSKEGESAETVQLLPDEYTRYLKAVYKKEKFPKPRNMLGLVKDLPNNEMKKLIIANTVVGENELQSLARERATAVMNHLVKKGGLPPERLFQRNDDVHKAPDNEKIGRSRVEFNVIAP